LRAQLAANRARAQQLAEEARRLIVGDYAGHASAIAETLTRLAKIDAEVQVMNNRLPPGTADIRIEGFRGYRAKLGETCATRDHFGRCGLLGNATSTPARRSMRFTRGTDCCVGLAVLASYVIRPDAVGLSQPRGPADNYPTGRFR
jgi:hypothetical protein